MSQHDPFDPTAEEARAEQRKARADEANRVEAGDINWLMGSKQGRRIMWRLLARAGMHRADFIPGMQALDAAFNSGARNIGLQYEALIDRHCPEQYGRMRMEQIQREQRST